jgi:hypothetical protein
MPYRKQFVFLALAAVVLAMGASRSLLAEPPGEPLPVGPAPTEFGYSAPEETATPAGQGATLAKPPTFPYGAPLVDYEAARTCWHHDYCKCRYSSCKRRAQCRAWGYPEEFCERPFGSFVRYNIRQQVANGLMDQMVLYHFDFFEVDTDQPDKLKPRGVRQVSKVAELATMLYDHFYVVTIEPTGDSELDNRRRLQVFEKLTDLGAPVALDQIATATPPVPGLDGPEATEIYRNQIKQTKQQGASATSESDPSVAGYLGPSTNRGGRGR